MKEKDDLFFKKYKVCQAVNKMLCEKDIRRQLTDIDERLLEYLSDIRPCDQGEDCNHRHNYYECLCALRFLRIFKAYPFDDKKVRQIIVFGEGFWEQTDGRWVHVRGGIKQPGPTGDIVYRWEPFQVFVLAAVFGPHAWVPTGNKAGTRELLPTEKEQDGMIVDLRRLCTDFTFFAPRKMNKTGLSAFIQVVFFFLEDSNAEIYCCANSKDQSDILYNRTRMMISQLDDGGHIRQTASVCDWRSAYRGIRNSSIRPLTAGGKTKDGMFAQLCSADEYGSSPWVKGKSEMKNLIDVIESSMGPRREPLTFTTTTAGTITEGPFIEKLKALHVMLDEEDGSSALQRDRTMCLLLEPDSWERDEETLLTSRIVRMKVNPMLGKIVQNSFYDDWAEKVRMESSKLPEYVSKLMNVYHSASMEEWITADDIRRLQVPMRVDDCKGDEGWVVFVGLDFSLGDDLHAMSYLCYNRRTGQFLADCDAWITEHAMERSAMREVFRSWVRSGWLSVSPGKTLQPELPVGRVASLFENRGISFGAFLYDPYKAKTPINALSAYFFSYFQRAGRVVDPTKIIIPCRQNYATFNPLVLEMDYLIKNDPPAIRFSQNALWQWEAGNMVLDTSTDGMDNRKPRKRDAGSKIDNFIALLEALHGFDLVNGRIQEKS